MYDRIIPAYLDFCDACNINVTDNYQTVLDKLEDFFVINSESESDFQGFAFNDLNCRKKGDTLSLSGTVEALRISIHDSKLNSFIKVSNSYNELVSTVSYLDLSYAFDKNYEFLLSDPDKSSPEYAECRNCAGLLLGFMRQGLDPVLFSIVAESLDSPREDIMNMLFDSLDGNEIVHKFSYSMAVREKASRKLGNLSAIKLPEIEYLNKGIK